MRRPTGSSCTTYVLVRTWPYMGWPSAHLPTARGPHHLNLPLGILPAPGHTALTPGRPSMHMALPWSAIDANGPTLVSHQCIWPYLGQPSMHMALPWSAIDAYGPTLVSHQCIWPYLGQPSMHMALPWSAINAYGLSLVSHRYIRPYLGQPSMHGPSMHMALPWSARS